MKGKFVIVNANNLTEYMKDAEGNIEVLDSLEDALNTCGINEPEDALILQVVERYQEMEVVDVIIQRNKIKSLIREYESYKFEWEEAEEMKSQSRDSKRDYRYWNIEAEVLEDLMENTVRKIKELNPSQRMIDKYPILNEIL